MRPDNRWWFEGIPLRLADSTTAIVPLIVTTVCYLSYVACPSCLRKTPLHGRCFILSFTFWFPIFFSFVSPRFPKLLNVIKVGGLRRFSFIISSDFLHLSNAVRFTIGSNLLCVDRRRRFRSLQVWRMRRHVWWIGGSFRKSSSSQYLRNIRTRDESPPTRDSYIWCGCDTESEREAIAAVCRMKGPLEKIISSVSSKVRFTWEFEALIATSQTFSSSTIKRINQPVAHGFVTRIAT